MFDFLKRYDVHLCSAVSGRLLNNGEPLVGIKVKRQLEYADNKTRIDTTRTDKQGAFTMPAVNIRSNTPGRLFAEPKTLQSIGFFYKKKFYPLWLTYLSMIEPCPAFDKKLSQLNADIKDAAVFFSFENINAPNRSSAASSICRWDSDFKIHHFEDDDGNKIK